LSRSDLDRLPMLINVLCGHMSIVGPCSYVSPPLVLFSHGLPDALQRSKLKPGLFCRAKLNFSHDGENERGRQIEDDLSYVTNWSLWLDVTIIAKTIASKRSYTM
jgi:putative colanic acid biosynthesis UDP-glucose lipid carrier transferase